MVHNTVEEVHAEVFALPRSFLHAMRGEATLGSHL